MEQSTDNHLVEERSALLSSFDRLMSVPDEVLLAHTYIPKNHQFAHKRFFLSTFGKVGMDARYVECFDAVHSALTVFMVTAMSQFQDNANEFYKCLGQLSNDIHMPIYAFCSDNVIDVGISTRIAVVQTILFGTFDGGRISNFVHVPHYRQPIDL